MVVPCAGWLRLAGPTVGRMRSTSLEPMGCVRRGYQHQSEARRDGDGVAMKKALW